MASTNDLIDQYLTGPQHLRSAVAGMNGEQLRARPIAGKWSTLEVVCHLADFEPVYADRMKRVMALDRPLLLGADESLFAARLSYQDREVEEELATIEAVRRSMARVLRAAPADAFQRTGVHSERGLNSLTDLLRTITGHIHHHVPFIAEKRRALGLEG